jgi:hypothetical protein
MMIKQSTARVISFGPFLDKTDGVTLETGLVSALDNGTTGIKLSKNGGALAVRAATVTASTYDSYGNYLVSLNATDTGTLGHLRVQMTDAATFLPVWADFEVVTANVFDSFQSTDNLSVKLTLATAEPTTPPGATATLTEKVNWIFAAVKNKISETSSQQLLRNDGDSATIGTAAISDDGTTFVRGKFS